MSILDKIAKSEKEIDLSTIVVAGDYKVEHQILCNEIEDKEFKKQVLDLLPKKRRSGLHQWKSRDRGFDVHLVTGGTLEEPPHLKDDGY